jgi:hypothetical protein
MPAYRTWGYPIPPLIFILGNLWIIYFSIKSRPAPVIWGVLTIVAGLGMYLYFERVRFGHRKLQEKNSQAVRTLFSDRGELGSKRFGKNQSKESHQKEDLS